MEILASNKETSRSHRGSERGVSPSALLPFSKVQKSDFHLSRTSVVLVAVDPSWFMTPSTFQNMNPNLTYGFPDSVLVDIALVFQFRLYRVPVKAHCSVYSPIKALTYAYILGFQASFFTLSRTFQPHVFSST